MDLPSLFLFTVQVGDFGLSKIKRNTLVSGGVRGTLPWMAPELLNGSSNKVSEKVKTFFLVFFFLQFFLAMFLMFLMGNESSIINMC